jgi:hypothetical protein
MGAWALDHKILYLDSQLQKIYMQKKCKDGYVFKIKIDVSLKKTL